MKTVTEKLIKALAAIKAFAETYKPETFEKAKNGIKLAGMIAEEALEEAELEKELA